MVDNHEPFRAVKDRITWGDNLLFTGRTVLQEARCHGVLLDVFTIVSNLHAFRLWYNVPRVSFHQAWFLSLDIFTSAILEPVVGSHLRNESIEWAVAISYQDLSQYFAIRPAISRVAMSGRGTI